MPIGVLWQDTGPRPLERKIKDAADYMRGKYGYSPDLCWIAPDEPNPQQLTSVEGCEIHIDTTGSVWPGYYFVGLKP